MEKAKGEQEHFSLENSLVVENKRHVAITIQEYVLK